MSMGELLNVEPLELKFPFELKKQISCSLQLSNKTENHVAFKVKTTNPKKYCVRPNTGIVLPRSTCDIIVTMQAQKEAPPDMQCKDKFLLQSVVASPGATPKDVGAEMFNKETGHVVEECKLRVVYLPPPQPPSPVAEGSEEGSSPKATVMENGNLNGSEVSRQYVEAHDISSEDLETDQQIGSGTLKGGLYWLDDPTAPVAAHHSQVRSLISKLTDEKNDALQQSSRLRQELELFRRGGNKSQGGVSLMFVIIFGLLGLVLGYIVKKT